MNKTVKLKSEHARHYLKSGKSRKLFHECAHHGRLASQESGKHAQNCTEDDVVCFSIPLIKENCILVNTPKFYSY